ncbi:sigma-70 family RNA polymerase sigma factor [Chryseomicrobium aureum]|uniref:sigma-70 family RNA polymerase sigma factor n=1 Tax=Chryseomicrobium aureum TaxID=1441723 RepID=UPI00370D78BF
MACRELDQRNQMMDMANQMIKDYGWMQSEIFRLQNRIYGGSLPMSTWGVAQYGIEAVMPKGSKGKSIDELKNLDSLENKRLARLNRYEAEVYILESLADSFQSEFQNIVYDCLLDRQTHRQIAAQLMTSKAQVQKCKKEILEQMIQSELIETFLLFGELDKFK